MTGLGHGLLLLYNVHRILIVIEEYVLGLVVYVGVIYETWRLTHRTSSRRRSHLPLHTANKFSNIQAFVARQVLLFLFVRSNGRLWWLILKLQILISHQDITDETTATAENVLVIVHLRGFLCRGNRGNRGLLFRRLTLNLGHVDLAATSRPGQEIKGLGYGTTWNYVGGAVRMALLVRSSHGEGLLVLHGHNRQLDRVR